MRNLLWLAVAASANGLTVPAAQREAVEKVPKPAREVAADNEGWMSCSFFKLNVPFCTFNSRFC